MEKKLLAVANWKMELSPKAAVELARSIHKLFRERRTNAELVVCPTFPTLSAIKQELESSSAIAVGCQDVHTDEKGAFTGKVSVLDVKDLVTWGIVGHSEVRAALGDTDLDVYQKMRMLLKHGVAPVVCIGESEQERAQDATVERITQQIEDLLNATNRTSLLKMAIAYEPIWAVGSDVTPSGDDVAEIVLLIRKIIAGRFDKDVADRVRIIYGGSVTAGNAGDFIGGPGADGLLIGRGSLHPRDLMDVIEAAEPVYRRSST